MSSRDLFRDMVITSSSVAALLHQAVAHHQAGRLDVAEALYSKALESDPSNADALNLLGAIAHGRNQLDRAKGLFERAIASDPGVPEVHFNIGNLLSAVYNIDGARSAYLRAIALSPRFSDAHLNLGVLLYKTDRFEEAAASFRQVIGITPSDPRGHFNLGQCLVQLSRPDNAEISLKRAVELAPDYLDAHLALAALYENADRFHDAIVHTRRAIALNPLPEYYSNLGNLLRSAGELEAALAALRTALAEKPNETIVLHNYGAALLAIGRLEEALLVFQNILVQDPKFVPAYVGLAKVYEFQGLYDDAVAALERGLALDPHSPDLIFKMSWLYLAVGDLMRGWQAYECRTEASFKKKTAPVRRATPPPYWAGEDLSGKTILIWTEQGLGEEILFASMVPDIIARAGHCILECTPRMVPVFGRSFPEAKVTGYKSQAVSETPTLCVEYQISAPSLGKFFRPDLDHFPRAKGYLKADPARVAVLRARYQALAPGQKIVGLSWRSKNRDIGEIKSADLASWGEILTTRGVTFVNLQYGECAAELDAVKKLLGVDIFQDRTVDPLNSMDDFFAQVAAMDAVISTSNTTVHVAGALNIPTWLMLARGPVSMWYWFLKGDVSPWYPSVRIIRYCGDVFTQGWWRDAVTRIAQELRGSILDS